MPAKLLWQGANAQVILEANGGALADNTIVEANDLAYDAAALDTYFWLELIAAWTTTPSDSDPKVVVYIQQAPDGTNYDDAPLTGGAQQYHKQLGVFPIRKVGSSTTQRIVVGPFLLPPHPTKFYLDNQTGQSMNSGWDLNLYRNALESQ